MKGQKKEVLLSKFLAKSCQTLLHFTTMLKLSKGPQLNCRRVNSTFIPQDYEELFTLYLLVSLEVTPSHFLFGSCCFGGDFPKG